MPLTLPFYGMAVVNRWRSLRNPACEGVGVTGLSRVVGIGVAAIFAVVLSVQSVVFKRLADRVGAFCSINRVSTWIMSKQKFKLVIATAFRDLIRHEIGKDLFHPHIIEPFHCNEITKPHVRSFMRDEIRPAILLVLCCAAIKK